MIYNFDYKNKIFSYANVYFFKVKVAKLAKNSKSFFLENFRIVFFFQAPTTATMLKFINQKEINKFEFTKTAKKCSFNFGKTFAPETEY